MVVVGSATRKARDVQRRRSRLVEQPAARADEVSLGFDRGYWLRHCEGFRVESPDGRLGVVEEIRAGDVLAVRAGRLGRRLLLVAASDVAFIVPRAERLWLRSSAILGSEVV